MPTYYEVKQGDCISSIAYEYGFFPETVWNHPSNAELKNKRKDPNTLCPGDVVVVPDKREKIITKPTGEMHKFRLNNTPALCSLQIFDQDDYRANQKYELEVDGIIYKGTTDSQGVLRVGIPPNAKTGKLSIGEDESKAEFNLQFGFIEPPTEMRGVQARLNNLGYECRINGRMDDDTRRALREFQFANGLQETGEIDQATLQKLDELHDTVCDIPNRDEVKKDDNQSQADNEIEAPFEEENEESEDTKNEISSESELETEENEDEGEKENIFEVSENKKEENGNEENKQSELNFEEEETEQENEEVKDNEKKSKDQPKTNSEEEEGEEKDSEGEKKNEIDSEEKEKSETESESETEGNSNNQSEESKDDKSENESVNDESEEDMKQ